MLNGQGTHIYFVHFLYSYIRFVDFTAVTRTAMSVSWPFFVCYLFDTAGDHKASIIRCVQKHNKNKKEIT